MAKNGALIVAGIVLSACAVPGEPQKLDRGVAYEIETVREADGR